MNVFLTGANGFIGGSIATALVKTGLKVRGLTRSIEGARHLESCGIEPVLGEIDNTPLLIAEAQKADVVFNTANADHLGAAQALIAGLQGSGKVLIHTSGTSIVGDDARGDFCAAATYSEDSHLMIDPRKQARRDIDLMVLGAAKLNIRSAVIAPSLIYGYGTGTNKESIQIPFLTRNALQAGAVQIVGKGLNTWSNLHIDDLVDLYLLVAEKTKPGMLYFAENGEASFLDLAGAIATRLGIEKIEHLNADTAVEKWGMARALFTFGSNSRVRAVRARKDLGWNPRHDSAQQWILSSMTVQG
jgi:nucleoside-diphosphate-sugar epimerase